MKTARRIATIVLLLTPSAFAQQSKITQLGEGKSSADSDQAYIIGGAVTWNASVTTALKENAEIMTKVNAALVKNGVTAPNTQTIRFSIDDHFKNTNDPQTGSRSQVKDGYTVTNKIKVTVCELPRLGETIDAMVAAGANDIDSIRMGSTKSAEFTDKARDSAVGEAERRAKAIAAKLGYELGDVITVNEMISHRDMGEADYATPSGMRETSSPTPIAGGSQEYKVNVEVTWKLVRTKKKIQIRLDDGEFFRNRRAPNIELKKDEADEKP